MDSNISNHHVNIHVRVDSLNQCHNRLYLNRIVATTLYIKEEKLLVFHHLKPSTFREPFYFLS